MEKKEDFVKSYYSGFSKLLNISLDDFIKYYEESSYGGYPEEASGSIWESEGKSIYVLIRALKPEKILEIGNFKGKSSNHILEAVDKNRFGKVVLLDIEERLEYDKLHNNDFYRVIDDSLNYLSKPIDFDLIIQDGDHRYEHVKKEISLILKNNIRSSYHIWSHDYYVRNKPNVCEVYKAWDEMKNNFKNFESFIDSKSDCGFSIAKK